MFTNDNRLKRGCSTPNKDTDELTFRWRGRLQKSN